MTHEDMKKLQTGKGFLVWGLEFEVWGWEGELFTIPIV
jgi:hypothetical protein